MVYEWINFNFNYKKKTLNKFKKEKDNQHSIEINNYQQTIKEQSSKIYTLQKEAKNYLV
jgi:hypothetical protein